jgi:two-component system invasion response regulator UvrY
MVEAIHAVISGKRYLSQDVANNLVFGSFGKENSSPFEGLSQRETEVTQLILRGHSIQQIAAILQLSDKTVNTYRYRLYSKLNVKNDVELTRLAVKMNYLES